MVEKPVIKENNSETEIDVISDNDNTITAKKATLNNSTKIKSKTSILGLMQKQQENVQQNAIVDYNSLPKNPFTIEEFVAKWNRYCYELKEQGKDTLHSAMTKRTPTLGSNNEILLQIDNKVQEEYINNIKLELLDFLRKELNNYSISLELLVEKDTTEKIAYTGKEKFEKMAQTNPKLIKLQQTLKLMIE